MKTVVEVLLAMAYSLVLSVIRLPRDYFFGESLPPFLGDLFLPFFGESFLPFLLLDFDVALNELASFLRD